MIVTKPHTEKIAEKYQVSQQEVLDIYNCVFEFIRKHISKIPLSGMTKEEFENTRTSFTIPGLGRLYTRHDRIEYLDKIFNKNKNENKENKTDVHSDCDDNGHVC